MAEFNVRPQPQLPNSYVGLSEGIRADRPTGLGRLFEGLADALDRGVKEADRNVQKNIEEDIFAEADAARAEFGVPEATDLQAPPEEVSERTAPEGVKKSVEQLERLQSAYQQGALKESHYWARLNASVRQLRGKYPGYRAEIDQMVSRITGANPANALRNALMNEWEAEAARASEYDKLVERAAFAGRLPGDFYERQKQGNPYSQNELVAHIARKEREEAEIADQRAALALEEDNNRLTKERVSKAFSVEANRFIGALLGDTATSVGISYEELSRRIKEAQEAAARGTPKNDAEIAQLRTMYGQIKREAQLRLDAISKQSWDGDPKHAYMVHLTPKERDDIIAQAMAPITLLEESLFSENFGITHAVGTMVEAQKTEAGRQFLENNPQALRMIGIAETLGQEALGTFFALVPAARAAWDQMLLNSIKMDMLTPNEGGGTIADGFDKIEKNGGSKESYQTLIDQWTSTADSIESGTLPIAAVQEAARYMFGPGSSRVFQKLQDDSKFEYFRKVASPAVTRQMMKLRDQGDIDTWNMYQGWVSRTFQVLFRDRVQDLQSRIKPEQFEVTFDEKNNRLKFTVTSYGLTLNGVKRLPAESDLWTRRTQREFEDLNTAIQLVAPIIEDNKGNTGMEILAVLQGLGFDPEAVKEPGFIEKFVIGVAKSIYEKAKDTVSESGVSKQQVMKFLFGKAAEGKTLYEALQMEPVVSKYGTGGE